MRCGTGSAGMTWASACKTWACAWRKAAAAASTSCWVVAAFGRLSWRRSSACALGSMACADASSACACFRRPGEVLTRDLGRELLAGELVSRRIERALRGIAVKLILAGINMNQRLPLMDEFIVFHVERKEEPGNPRRYGYRPPVRIRIVGRFNIAG